MVRSERRRWQWYEATPSPPTPASLSRVRRSEREARRGAAAGGALPRPAAASSPAGRPAEAPSASRLTGHVPAAPRFHTACSVGEGTPPDKKN